MCRSRVSELSGSQIHRRLPRKRKMMPLSAGRGSTLGCPRQGWRIPSSMVPFLYVRPKGSPGRSRSVLRLCHPGHIPEVGPLSEANLPRHSKAIPI